MSGMDWMRPRLEALPGNISALCRNLETGESFAFRPEARHGSASVIKLYLMAAMFQGFADGEFRPEDRLTVREKDCVPSCGVLTYLDRDQEWSLRDLTELMIIVSDNAARLALARTPDELWQNKLAGKKSIMLGIENGKALEGKLSNVQHFAQRGIVYITLCHNGDNDICDSAKGMMTFGGVSSFGVDVIKEMNRLGLMVDLSHAHEKSFYDALDISKTPIVCSHSSCRALCDHPRNLTDDQMRALAKKGGVCQITVYPGFLRTDSQATIIDVRRRRRRAWTGRRQRTLALHTSAAAAPI